MTAETGASFVYKSLREAGVDLIVGLPGTQTLPIDREIATRDAIDFVMARHETAIPHIAWGYFEIAGRPAATLTVPGPGETNAMHGWKNALEDCVPMVQLTGDADPAWFGRKPIHEIDPQTYDPVVKENVIVDSIESLPQAVIAGIREGLTPPFGPVRLGIPTTYYDREVDASVPSITPGSVQRSESVPYDEAADLLADAERPIVLIGGGVVRSASGPDATRELIHVLDAPFLTTYKGKGVVSEEDDRYLGAIAGSLPPGAVEALSRADVVVALGTDLDGICTKNWSIPMGEALIHVNIDPNAIGASYDVSVGIVDDAGIAAERLCGALANRDDGDRWDGREIGTAVRNEYDAILRDQGLLDPNRPLHTPAALRAVAETIPDDVIVTTDVGGFRVWAMQTFPVTDWSRFVTAGSWAGMGVGLPAAIGAKLARPDSPVVCLSGDGGLFMCLHEMATVAEENLDIVLVVFNNSDYAIISQRFGENHPASYPPFGWTSPSFTQIADGFGWASATVEEATGLRVALEAALDRHGPTLIDVDITAKEPSAAQAIPAETAVSFK